MKTALSLLVLAAAASVDAGYVAPVASGYIYRNDNHGPASLIQLGAVPYQQPHVFAPPLPLAQPLAHPLQLQAFEAYDLASAPAPLPYIAPQPIIVEDSEEDEDDDEDSSEEYLDAGDSLEHHGDLGQTHGHVYEKGAGSDFGEEYHKAHGEKGSKGYSSKDHHEDGKSGNYGKKHQEGHYHENKGEANSHHDEADAHGKHYESGKGYKGGDQGHKKHFSKGEDVTGYHKIFHKDEFKKDHDFYDISDNSGHFKKYDNDHEKHGSAAGGHKEGAHGDTAYDKGEFGKNGFHAKGNIKESEEGHSEEEGNESQYSREEDYGNKGGSSHEKEYIHDDDEDED